MEVAGFAIGVLGAVGTVGQLLDGCLKAYKVFTAASNLGRDSERLLCKIKIEEMRLAIWGREWGVADGTFEQTFAAGAPNAELRSVAELILTQLYETVVDLNRLQARYGLKEESPGAVDRDAYRQAATDVKKLLARGRADGGLRLKARWVIGDRDKFADFLGDLQFFNDRLERLFPPARLGLLQRNWTAALLEGARRDTGALQTLRDASSPNYPALGTFAELKTLRVNLDAQAASGKILSSSELKLPRARLTVDAADAAVAASLPPPHRSRAVYQKPLDKILADGRAHEDVQVFVEWTSFDSGCDFEQRCNIYQRVDNLARMLHSSSNRHPDLHTPDCLGYVDDTSNSRYGLVYVLPSSPSLPSHSLTATPSAPPEANPPQAKTMTSLATLISSDAPTPDLDVRFRLARTLAVALWSCHSLDWLHKSLCPANVLFFSSSSSSSSSSSTAAASTTNGGDKASTSARALSTPYLAGFESSRPEHLDEMSVAPPSFSALALTRSTSSSASVPTLTPSPSQSDTALAPDAPPTTPQATHPRTTTLATALLYRHPSSQGLHRAPFRKAFDIYALGLVLLEIGLWRCSVETVASGISGSSTSSRRASAGRARNMTPAMLRERVVAGLVPALGARVGGTYRNVVAACIAYGGGVGVKGVDAAEENREGEGEDVDAFWDEKERKVRRCSPHAMMEWVVQSLEGLHV